MNAANNVLITPCAKAWIEKSILYLEFLPSKKLTLEDAKEHIRMIQKEFKDQLPLPCLSDIRNLKQADKDARNYLGGLEVASLNKAVAIIGPSGLSKIVGNLFLKFTRPQYPSKIFSDSNKATEWLKEFK